MIAGAPVLLLTATDAVAQSDVDPAGQLLINQPQRQSADLQQVDDETADQEHIADEEVAHELGLQHLHEAHASGKTQTTTTTTKKRQERGIERYITTFTSSRRSDMRRHVSTFGSDKHG